MRVRFLKTMKLNPVFSLMRSELPYAFTTGSPQNGRGGVDLAIEAVLRSVRSALGRRDELGHMQQGGRSKHTLVHG